MRRLSRGSVTKTAPTPPTGIKLRAKSKLLPLSWRDSFGQWLRRKELVGAERSVLDCVDLDPMQPNSQFDVRSINTEVAPGQFINELELGATRSAARDATSTKHVVLVHGYGACKGFFYRNYRALASVPGVKVHALDWLGYGLSTRVPVDIKLGAPRKDKVLHAERFFADSLEVWRQKRGISKFSFVAHSLGAYIATGYALKHPELVEKIALVSPASVNRSADAIPRAELGLTPLDKADIPPNFRVPSWFRWGWERHWSPFAPVRLAGPLGPKLVSLWTSRRFAQLPKRDRDALHIYAYTMFNAPGSGEYLLNSLLAPGGMGRWPLVDRVQNLSPKIKTLWMYGDRDWMDIRGGLAAAKIINDQGGSAQVVEVPKSGHHLYLDNVKVFNDTVTRFLARE